MSKADKGSQAGTASDARAGRGGSAPADAPHESSGVADLYRLLVESVVDYAIFVLDPEGRIASWNPGAQRLKGYTESEIIGRHFSTFYPAEDVRDGKPAKELAIALRDGRVEDEGWRVKKDGSRFWANVVITALYDDSDLHVGFAKITRDLTRRREAEEQARQLAASEAGRERAVQEKEEVLALSRLLKDQTDEYRAQTEEMQSLAAELEETNEQLAKAIVTANRARDQAEQANRVKMDFLGVMSHELRTPLNAIAGYAELLKIGVHGPLTSKQEQDVDRILRSERSLLALINDILNYAKLEAGHVDIRFGSIEVQDTLLDIEAAVLPQLEAKGLVYRTNLCPARVRGDADKFRQIVLNLLSNAIKFTEAGGSISLSCTTDDKIVKIEVSDTGKGIPRDRLDAIFDPFVQVDKNLTRENEGTGLGLAISRDLAQLMHGELTVQSEMGKGSTFTLRLPDASATADQGADAAAAPRTPRSPHSSTG
jgi:PAS domain S-box-containing protein